ncbi:Putative DNA replication complex GINS protein Psf2 [Septoria linicola]|uniref:DNA replication complex GINS protein PSF2 n=1 Tax=Septoria linicola TaxID=215465 RepID=A0A9Q9EPP1_9PEZI|nr:putative DNA replication complex GINS protein Psf2 [Septoria linicola]USW58290.1 Putative DNA replication complex GINS protein Psf2 [Septoria linicola]
MALPLPPGLTPNEVGFLCEMELVTVIPRQRLEGLELLGGPTERLNPPFPAQLPLWLALLLKRQKRANISPPAWLSTSSLQSLLDLETDQRLGGALTPAPDFPQATGISLASEPYLSKDGMEMSSPFMKNSSTNRAQDDALPYHWNELGYLLLTHASDDFDDPDMVRRLLRDLREVRMSKLRKGFKALDAGAGLKVNGIGGMEVAEIRGFVGGVVDGLRRLNMAREENQVAEEADGQDALGGSRNYQDDDDDMEL